MVKLYPIPQQDGPNLCPPLTIKEYEPKDKCPLEIGGLEDLLLEKSWIILMHNELRLLAYKAGPARRKNAKGEESKIFVNITIPLIEPGDEDYCANKALLERAYEIVDKNIKKSIIRIYYGTFGENFFTVWVKNPSRRTRDEFDEALQSSTGITYYKLK